MSTPDPPDAGEHVTVTESEVSIRQRDVFVLDQADNPHPRMLSEALLARACRFDSTEALAYWHGYLAAMCGATGCPPDEIEMWMDRQ